jgi:hypothetical protein
MCAAAVEPVDARKAVMGPEEGMVAVPLPIDDEYVPIRSARQHRRVRSALLARIF